jgi:hypothetical protein
VTTSVPRHIVTIQARICTPLGTMISMLAATKKFMPMIGRPTAYMWWTHRPKLMKPMATSVTTSSV